MIFAAATSLVVPARAADIQRVVSPGGIEAWLVEEHSIPLVAFNFAFRGGATQDPDGKEGLAALMAGTLDEGAGDLTSASFQERLEEKAIDLSFRADRDALTGGLRTLTENLDAAVDLLSLALGKPRFDQEPVDRIRAQISARLRRDERDPEDIAGRAFMRTAFPGHPYGRPVNGTLQSLAAITREDVVGAARRLMARDNLVIGVVGDIDAKTLAGKLDAAFGGLPARAELRPVADVAPKVLPQAQVVELPVPQTAIIFGRQGPLRKDDDFIPAFVLNHILGGGGFSSRLFTEVREKRGLAYSVYSYLAPYDHAGMVLGGVATRNDRAGESLRIIREEIRRLAADGPTEAELEKAKKFLIGSYPLRFDSSLKIADQLVQLQLDDLGMDYPLKRNALIEAVTAEDIRRAAKKLFGEGELLVVAVGQPTDLGAAVKITDAVMSGAKSAPEPVPAAQPEN